MAPPEAPVTGYMVCQEEASRCCTFVLFLFSILREFSRFGLNHFYPLKPTILSFSIQFGKGIYFSDMSSKSANYCFANQSNHVGLLLLCEVSWTLPFSPLCSHLFVPLKTAAKKELQSAPAGWKEYPNTQISGICSRNIQEEYLCHLGLLICCDPYKYSSSKYIFRHFSKMIE